MLIERLNIESIILTEENQSFPHDCDKRNPVNDLQRHHRRAEKTQQIEHKSHLFDMIEIISQKLPNRHFEASGGEKS
jgi:hypothetical protein